MTIVPVTGELQTLVVQEIAEGTLPKEVLTDHVPWSVVGLLTEARG